MRIVLATRNPGKVAELRALLADHLHKLGDSDAAQRAMDPDHAEEPAPEEAEALWSRVLRAALMGPEDLRED